MKSAQHIGSRLTKVIQHRTPHSFRKSASQIAETPNQALHVGQARPPFALLSRHFISCAIPMVGFGMMDNTILIRAGDAIDRHFGADLNLSSIEAAACGQVLSDFCGVVCGGVVESLSRYFILPPVFSASQLTLRITQVVGTAGAATGVVVGCVLGMGNLVFMDLEEAERRKRMAELEHIFTVVIQSAKETIGANMGSIFLVDEDSNELWSRVQTNVDKAIRLPLNATSIAGWVALNNKRLLAPDAYAEPLFNPEVDFRTGVRTSNLVAIPVTSQADPNKVIAVIELLNKEGGFNESDLRTCHMLSIHVSVFLSKCE